MPNIELSEQGVSVDALHDVSYSRQLFSRMSRLSHSSLARLCLSIIYRRVVDMLGPTQQNASKHKQKSGQDDSPHLPGLQQQKPGK